MIAWRLRLRLALLQQARLGAPRTATTSSTPSFIAAGVSLASAPPVCIHLRARVERGAPSLGEGQ